MLTKKLSYVFVSLFAISILFNCSRNIKADIVVIADDIYTSSNGVHARAFAVKDGRYIAVGGEEEINQYVGENTKKYNATFAMSGAVESHGHFILEQAFKLGCYINPKDGTDSPKTFNNIISDIVSYKSSHPSLTKIYGYGWDFSINGAPILQDLTALDQAFPDIPVFISECSLHGAWVNSKCFELAGIDPVSGANDPEGIIIDRDISGHILGVARDETCSYIRNKVFQELLDDQNYKKAVKNAARFLNSLGYTSHYDMWSNFDGTDKMYKAIDAADKDGDLDFLFSAAYCVESFEKDKASIMINHAVDLKKQYESQHFKPNYLKMFADGVVEIYTGYCSKSYVTPAESEPNYGTRIWTPNEMDTIVNEANKKGLLVHIHTMGDAAVHEALHAFVNSENNNGYSRNSLGHVALINNEDLYTLKDHNLAVSSGAYWARQTTEAELAHYRDNVFGDERFRELYPYKEYVDFGIKAALHTDDPCTVGILDLFGYIQVLLNGIDYSKPTEGTVEKRIGKYIKLKDAIDMFTINGAWMNNLENERGSIEVGKFADFILTDKNPFNENINNVHDVKITNTFFEGKQVYSA